MGHFPCINLNWITKSFFFRVRGFYDPFPLRASPPPGKYVKERKKLSITERRDGLVSWYNLDIFKRTKETLQLRLMCTNPFIHTFIINIPEIQRPDFQRVQKSQWDLFTKSIPGLAILT